MNFLATRRTNSLTFAKFSNLPGYLLLVILLGPISQSFAEHNSDPAAPEIDATGSIPNNVYINTDNVIHRGTRPRRNPAEHQQNNHQREHCVFSVEHDHIHCNEESTTSHAPSDNRVLILPLQTPYGSDFKPSNLHSSQLIFRLPVYRSHQRKQYYSNHQYGGTVGHFNSRRQNTWQRHSNNHVNSRQRNHYRQNNHKNNHQNNHQNNHRQKGHHGYQGKSNHW